MAISTANGGTSQSFTVNSVAGTTKTNFGCSGINEENNTLFPLVGSITRPDNTSFTFTYEPAVGGGGFTGRLASMRIPEGGTITYGYSGGNNGIDCTYFNPPTLTRTQNDGSNSTWTYSVVHNSTTQSTTTVTEKIGATTIATTVYTFKRVDPNLGGSGAWFETQRLIYSGASTLMKTINTIYNNNGSANPDFPITQKEVDTILPGLAASKVIETYDQTYGVLTSVSNYDFGAGTPTNSVLIAYGSWTGSTCAPIPNIHDHVCYKTTHAGATNSPTIIANHTNQYDLSAGNVGNLLNEKDWVSGGNWLIKNYSYDPNGALRTSQDINGTTTTYTNGACNGFLPTSTSVAGLSSQATWDCNGGVQTSSTDPNGDATTYDFANGGADPFYRVKAIISPSPFNDTTTFSYTPNSVQSSMVFGSSIVHSGTTTDTFGRPILQQKRQSPTSSTYDTVQTSYDYRGRVYQTTRPCSAAWGTGCSSTGATTHSYDVLNRHTSVVDGGGGQVTTAYTKNDVTFTLNPKPTGDLHNKVRNYEYDGLGRLQSVCEVTTLSGNGSCGQVVTNNGYVTTYTYDLINNRFMVNQGAQSRTIYHDGLGRTTTETNPENGTVQYTYDNMPTPCAGAPLTFNGDMVTKVDQAGSRTCLYYDGLHRLYQAGFTGPVCRRFWFDQSYSPLPSGITVSNTLGRLEGATTDDCAGTGKTSEFFSYDNNGRLTDVYQSTPNSGGYYHSTASYYPNGSLASLSPGIGGNQVTLPWTFALDGEGRTYSESNPNGLILQSTTYNVDGTISAVTHVSGDSDSFQYNANTGRMTQYKFTVGSTPKSLVGNLTWNANGTLQQQQIVTDQFNAANVQTCTYTYDDLTRLATGNCGTPWSQAYTYDQFGNVLQKSGNGPFQAFYPNPNTTNRISTISGEPNPSYDANGNLLSAESHTFSWDPNWGNPSAIDGKTLTYDALGRMVEIQNGSATTQFMFGPTGKIAVMNGQTEVQSFQPFPGGGVFVHRPGSLTNYWRHADLLGSSRLATTLPGRTLFYDGAYAPFGENYAETGTTDRFFSGQMQDTASTFGGIYDFMFRKYSPVQGRWLSPDPAGMGAADPNDPQTWNRYAYVINGPLSFVDTLGLACYGFEKREFKTCAPFMNNGVNFGSNWNEFDIMNIPITKKTWGWIPNTPDSGVSSPSNPMASNTQVLAYWGMTSIHVGTGFDFMSTYCALFCGTDGTEVFRRNYATGAATIRAGDRNFKKEFCDQQSNLAAADAVLPGLGHALNGDYRPVAATAASTAATEAATTAASTYSMLYTIRSLTGIPMSVTSKLITGFGVVGGVVTGYNAYKAMHDTYQACMSN